MPSDAGYPTSRFLNDAPSTSKDNFIWDSMLHKAFVLIPRSLLATLTVVISDNTLITISC